MTSATDFDDSFAAPAQWAALYRAYGLQVVPAKSHREDKLNWKRPALPEWRQLEYELAPDLTFQRWYGDDGQHASRTNMGLITGSCSGGVFVVDLDTHTKPQAAAWWAGLLAVHANGLDFETPRQTTGGGGKQILFRAPAGWTPPTCKTALGVDIRGQGGFAMLPPSTHESGRSYEWDNGSEPWTVAIADAPDWLCEAIDALVGEHGGTPQAQRERVAASGAVTAFGRDLDGREDKMTRLIWARLVALKREAPMISARELDAARDDAWAVYERTTATRLQHPGLSNADGLEREGRGLTVFCQKWARSCRKWDDEIAEEARKPVADKDRPKLQTLRFDPETGEVLDELTAANDQEKRAEGASGNLLLSAAEFVAGFTPPSYLIDGIVQRGYLYSLTARTGHGKTAVDLYLCQCLARGVPAHGRKVTPGAVLFCAGENADDIRARWIVLADRVGFDIAQTPVFFIDGIINIKASTPRIVEEANRIAGLGLVVVDTAAAYFTGDDPNNNAQQVAFARDLRALTVQIASKPALIVNCHPVKNASRDNLIPMGGSALLNEVDGNLTLWADGDGATSLHWQGKFRGPEFEPLTFKIETAFSDRVVDADGRRMPSVVAAPMSDMEVEMTLATSESDENVVLAIVGHNKGASVAAMAKKANWKTAAGLPHKSKVARILGRLSEDKLIARYRGTKYAITEKGKAVLGWSDDD